MVEVMIRWRLFFIVFAADVVKMYRQFFADERDRDWLRIMWRDFPQNALQVYRMTTVVYGTSSAPFMANRALLQLAEDELENLPLGAAILKNHTYVDDIFGGGDSEEDASLTRNETVTMLKRAGLDLDRWASNNPALLKSIASTSKEIKIYNEDDFISILGVQWNPSGDYFCYKVTLPLEAPTITKRTMLSVIARLFDLFGWLSPVVIVGKILIQQLWISGTDWDQPIPEDILNSWITLREQLPSLEELRIPRWTGNQKTSTWYLHGFSDASTLAYAAVIYIVTETAQGVYQTSQLIAKSKVAPIKTISVPRLELCGALLLARLMHKVAGVLQCPSSKIYCWSDSQVVLAWLRSQPSKWTPFVANRVSEIHTKVPEVSWSHVKTAENPADLASRGVMPRKMAAQTLWWNGPSWLVTQWQQWGSSTPTHSTVLEIRRTCNLFTTSLQTKLIEPWLQGISRLTIAVRAIAYALRWLSLVRNRKLGRPSSVLTANEICQAEQTLIFALQREYYAEEITQLQGNRLLPAVSPLIRLMPFIDPQGLLRVGGRLQNAMHTSYLTYNESHPIIVPSDSHLSKLLIRNAHISTLHGGPQLVASQLVRKYWIVRSRNLIRQLVRKCVRCTRFRKQLQVQQMAPLPAIRITPIRPFSTVGLDYAGPYMLRTSKGRGQTAHKGFLALFICMVTRAVHLEIVTGLTSPAFIAAFKRFAARRSLCNLIVSDNSTTFHGASAELDRLFNQASLFSREVAELLANDRVEWRFIPPRAPHFGGLWEAGIKSCKHHLRRVLGDAKLTYEEFSTLAAEIEACLNSRPLTPLSSNPEDFAALTPGHFWTGTAITAVPEPPSSDLSAPGIPRYKWTTLMRNSFWKRWQKEVLYQYQQRQKWLKPSMDVRAGDLVLISDDQQPPTKWPLARVLQLHPGSDNLNRVLTLRTATSTYKRPLAKVIRLPVDPESTQIPTSVSHAGRSASQDPSDSAMAGGTQEETEESLREETN